MHVHFRGIQVVVHGSYIDKLMRDPTREIQGRLIRPAEISYPKQPRGA